MTPRGLVWRVVEAPWSVVLTAAAAIAILGTVCLSYGLLHMGLRTLPQPVAAAARLPSEPHPSLSSSEPTLITIPAIGVQSAVMQVGRNADGTPAAPSGATVDDAAWLTSSVTPGAQGVAVIVGHVDTVRSGPSVFYNLYKLKPGDGIAVQRKDNRTAGFTVSAVRAYDKDAIPNDVVYGQTASAMLRLITCAGVWDAQSDQYNQNLVVFATLTDVR